jgi:anti-sigma B factor antagonist
MDIDMRKFGHVHVYRLRGPLTLGPPVDELQKILWQTMDSGESHLVLNLKDVARIDSSGIGLLVKALSLAKERGGAVKLVNPSVLVLRTLKMCALLPLFEIHEEEEAAIQSFGE